MNTVKNLTTIHWWLNQIDVLELVILLMTCLIKYVSNKTEDLNMHAFNMITGRNESKTLAADKSCECKCEFDGRKYN